MKSIILSIPISYFSERMQTIAKTTLRVTLVAVITGLVYLTACERGETNPQQTNAATKFITTQGGSLTAVDNRVTVTLPQGAVGANTEISIEKTNEVAPKGIGNVYRITPEGTTFGKPVTISFKYSDADAQKVNPALMAIAYKKADGGWEVMPDVQINEKTKTIATQSRHFSEWALLEVEEGITFSTPTMSKTTFSSQPFAYYTLVTDSQPDSTWLINARVANVKYEVGKNEINISARKNSIDKAYFSSGEELSSADNFYGISINLPDRDYQVNYDFSRDGSVQGDSVCYLKVSQIGRKKGEYNVGSFSMPMKYKTLTGDTLVPLVKEVVTGYFRIKTTY